MEFTGIFYTKTKGTVSQRERFLRRAESAAKSRHSSMRSNFEQLAGLVPTIQLLSIVSAITRSAVTSGQVIRIDHYHLLSNYTRSLLLQHGQPLSLSDRVYVIYFFFSTLTSLCSPLAKATRFPTVRRLR